MVELNVYRVRSLVETIRVDDKAVLTQRAYGENQITVNTVQREPLNIQVGDYILYNTIKYIINTLPNSNKISTREYRYEIVFEAEYYNFSKVQYRLDENGEFDLMSNLEGFVDLIVTNMNRVYGTGYWAKGAFAQTNQEYKLLHFSNESCRQVMQRLCEEFQGEFYFDRYQICFTDEAYTDPSVTLEYKSGLRGIKRTASNDQDIVTRLYVHGSDKNLAPDYGRKRLKIMNPRNLLTNPNFETGDFTGWTKYETYGGAATIYPGHAIDGLWVCSLESGPSIPGHQWVQQTISANLPASCVFTLSGYVYTVLGTTGTIGLCLEVHYTDASYDVYYDSTGTVVEESVYKFYSVSSTANSAKTIDHLVVYAPWTNNLWGTVYGDNIQLEYNDYATDFTTSTTIYYLEKNTEEYGIIEGSVTFDEIYPSRTGTVDGINPLNRNLFTDSSIDFDVNSYLLPGITAKVHWQTGDLAGYAFDLTAFDNVSKQFEMIPQDMPEGQTWPNTTIYADTGDTYKLIDIYMPTTYVTLAEMNLLTFGIKRLNEICAPRVTYEVDPDPRYYKTNDILLNLGDKVTVVDTDLGINKLVRVTELSRSLIDEYDYSFKLSDVVEAPLSMRLYARTQSLNNGASVSKIADTLKAQRTWRDTDEVLHLISGPTPLQG